jgi:replicative DNA helicase
MADPVTEILANWETLSTRVLATIFVDPGAAIKVADIIGHNTHWIPQVHREVYKGVLACVEGEKAIAPTTTNVSARCGGRKGTEIVVLEALAATYTASVGRDLLSNTEALKALGLMFELRGIGDLLTNVVNPDDVEDLIAYSEVALQAVTANKTEREADAKSISDAAWSFQGEPVKSGLEWFDDIAGGYWTYMISWIAARYKGGKSTLMRNLALVAAENGVPIDIFIAEGSREGLALDFQVMMAVRWLVRGGEEVMNIRLSKLLVTRSIVTPDEVKLTPQEKEALKMARADFERLPLRIWDAQDGIHNLITLVYKARTSRMEYGTKVIFIDYAQLLTTPGVAGVYEQSVSTAVTLQKLAAKEGIAVVVIAQKNERGVRQSGGLDGGYSPEVSGGGSGPQTADFLWQPHLTKPPQFGGKLSVMLLPLTHSRHTDTGRGSHAVHPGSGLFVDDFVKFTRMELETLAEADVVEGAQYVPLGG